MKSRILTLLFAVALAPLAHAAGLEGKWTTQFDTEGGALIYTFEFVRGEDQAMKLRASYNLPMYGMSGVATVSELKIDGEKVSFKETSDFQGYAVLTTAYEGVLAGDEIKFKRTPTGAPAPIDQIATRAK